MILPLALALVAGCSTPPPAPAPEAKPAAPACGVDAGSLAGSSWTHMKPLATGGEKSNPIARVKFEDKEGKLLAKYTAGSLGDVYDYGCTLTGKTVTCVETDIHADAWCMAWAATHEGVCDPAGVAAALKLAPEAFTEAAASVNKKIKALKPADRANQAKLDNSPNNKIRGKFMVALDPATCRITLVDKYQTMVDGKLNEYENVLGTSKFEKATEEYIYESCKDSHSAWAPSEADEHEPVQGPGTIKFSAMVQKAEKGKGTCTYSADVYKDWVKSQTDVPAVEDKKWGPRWDTQIPFMETGKHAVYFDRYKTCDGKKERIGLTCAVVRVE